MFPDFASEQDLFERLTDSPEDVVFLVGSALTAPTRDGGPGVPGVEGVIEMIRAGWYPKPDSRQRFEESLANELGNRYQAAFKHLAKTRGPDAMNLVVQRCVLKARSKPLSADKKLSPEECRRLEDDLSGWYLPAGVDALGRILAQAASRRIVLTSNFDPLIAVSVRRHGGSAYIAAMHSDGSLGGIDGRGCMVVHFHGDWSRTDTLHTPTQLGQDRPQLSASLAQLLSERTLVVLGYSGWDDVFTRSLRDLIVGELAPLKVAWAFYGDDEDRLRRDHQRLFTLLKGGIERQRVILYKGIDIRRFLPRLADELAPAPRGTSTPLPPPPPAPETPRPPQDAGRAPEHGDIQPPGAGFDPRWYIPRGKERRAVTDLVSHGGVLISSVPKGGKSTFTNAVIAQLRAKKPSQICVISVGLGELSSTALQDPSQCLHELSALVSRKYREEMKKQFGESVADSEASSFLDEIRALLVRANAAGRTLVLVLDRFERLLAQKHVGLEVARVLRALRDECNTYGHPLSLLLAASGTNLHSSGADDLSELANVCDWIYLERFTIADLERLAEQHSQSWTVQELGELHRLFGGHPYLTRSLMFLESQGTLRQELLADERHNFRHLGTKLRELWVAVNAQPELRNAICGLLGQKGLSIDDVERLRVSGFVDESARSLSIAGSMIEAYFRERC